MMAKVVCVLYDDPVDGYPKTYARDDLPKLERYPDGQTLPTPEGHRLQARHACSAASPASWASGNISKPTATSSWSRPTRRAPNSTLDKELADAEIVISQPFWPAYLTAERMAKAPKLKLAITAGIGSDHVDLDAAMKHGVTVAEVHLLQLHQRRRARGDDDPWPGAQLSPLVSSGCVKGGWNIADCVERSYDLEGMNVGTVAAGRIGLAVLRRLKPFDVKLHYTDRHRLPAEVEKELGLTFHPDVESLVKVCDVVTINAPLHKETEHMFNDKLIAKMKRGAYLINTARGKIVDRDAIVGALEVRPARRLCG